jgi:hypothetical protein
VWMGRIGNYQHKTREIVMLISIERGENERDGHKYRYIGMVDEVLVFR